MSTQSLSTAVEELSWVVCPVCHKELQREADTISCKGCGRRYPVVDGIAVLLVAWAL